MEIKNQYYNCVGFCGSFKGKADGNSSNQEKTVDNPINGFSKEYSDATRAVTMAQIMMGANIKYDTTADEYITQLIKQGKRPDKDFSIKKEGQDTIITEFSRKGEKLKETNFYDKTKDRGVSCSFYNPETQVKYKSIEYTKQGGVAVAYNDPETEKPLIDEQDKPDGTLDLNYAYKNEN